MSVPSHRVVIVGAGPAGSSAAIALARRGIGPVLVVDRARFPRPKACGGGLSPRAVALLGRLRLGAAVLDRAHRVESLRFVGPGGEESILRGTPALVMNRRDLDMALVAEARRLGVEVREGFEARALLRDGGVGVGGSGRVVGVSDGASRIAADVVVVADGAPSRFSPDPRPRTVITTVMGWYDGFDAPAGRMEMIFDRRLLPYYAWVFPESAGRVNIGICHPGRSGSLNLRSLYAELLDDQFGPRIRSARQVGPLRGHPISTTAWIGDVARPGALWIGEAARLANAATGEGIHHAVASGVSAAEAIAGAADRGRDVGLVGDAYTGLLRRRLGPGLAGGGVFRAVASGPLFPAICRVGANPLVRRLLTRILEGM